MIKLSEKRFLSVNRYQANDMLIVNISLGSENVICGYIKVTFFTEECRV